MRRKGSNSAAMERALKAWNADLLPAEVLALALRCGVSPSGLYRALVRDGRITPTKRAPKPAEPTESGSAV